MIKTLMTEIREFATRGVTPLFVPLSVVLGLPLDRRQGPLPAGLQENGPDRLLTRGMPSGNVEDLLHGLWLVAVEIMHLGSTVHVRPEHRDDVGVANLEELVTLSGETSDVIPHGFILILLATL
jgi:hypothetical protein